MPVQGSLLYAVSGKYLPVFGERSASLMIPVKSNALNTDLLHDFANIVSSLSSVTLKILVMLGAS